MAPSPHPRAVFDVRSPEDYDDTAPDNGVNCKEKLNHGLPASLPSAERALVSALPACRRKQAGIIRRGMKP